MTRTSDSGPVGDAAPRSDAQFKKTEPIDADCENDDPRFDAEAVKSKPFSVGIEDIEARNPSKKRKRGPRKPRIRSDEEDEGTGLDALSAGTQVNYTKPGSINVNIAEARTARIVQQLPANEVTELVELRLAQTAQSQAILELPKTNRAAREKKWEMAGINCQLLRKLQPNDEELAAFDEAIVEEFQRLLSWDQHQRKKSRSSKSRLHRTLLGVCRQPRFYASCATFAKQSLGDASIMPAEQMKLSIIGPGNQQTTTNTVDQASTMIPHISSDRSRVIDCTFRTQVPLSDRSTSEMSEDNNGLLASMTIKHEAPADDAAKYVSSRKLRFEQMSVWERHEDTMYVHLLAKGFSQAVCKAKLAIQEKSFWSQAANEVQVAKAQQIMEEHAKRGSRSCITDFGGTLFDTEFPEEALWELSSTKLWQYYEGGNSWDQLGWIPGGYLHVRRSRPLFQDEDSFQADVVLEVGATSCIAEVAIPLFTNPHPLEFFAQSHGLDRDCGLSVCLSFLNGRHVKLSIPASPLINLDSGCDHSRVAGEAIEFAGVLMNDIG